MARKGLTLLELVVLISGVALLVIILLPVFTEARETLRQNVCMNNLKELGLGVLLYSSDYDGCAPGPAHPLGSSLGYPRNEHVTWEVLIEPYVFSRRLYECPSKPGWCVAGSMALDPDSVCMQTLPVPAAWRGLSVGYAMNPLLQQSVDVGDESGSWWNYGAMENGALSPSAGWGGKNLSRLIDPSRVIMLSDANNVGENCGEKPNWPNVCGKYLPRCSFDTATPAYARHNGGNNWAFADGHVEWVQAGKYECVTSDVHPGPEQRHTASDEVILSGNTMQKVHGVDQLN